MSLGKRLPFHKRIWLVVLIWVRTCFDALSNNQLISTCQSDRPGKAGGLQIIAGQDHNNHTVSFDELKAPFGVLETDKRFSRWHEGTKAYMYLRSNPLGKEPTNNTLGESDSESNEEKQKKQEKKRTSKCSCQCRLSDRAKAGRFRSRPCRFQWKRLSNAIPTPHTACNRSNPGTVKPASPGRRCRRLQSRAWNVDAIPNPKGQTKRNCLSCQDKKVNLFSLGLNCPGRNGHKGVVDLLLMSEHQRRGTEGSAVLNFVRQVVVSLACLALLLGDHSGQKTVRLTKRFLPLLLPRPVAANKGTASMEQATKNFFRFDALDPTLSSDRNTRRFRPLKKECKFRPGTRELPVSQCCCLRNSAAKDRKLLKWNLSFGLKLLKTNPFVDMVVPPTNLWVAPATGFLPSMTSRDTHCLDHVGYRLASLAALPPSCSVSRVRLAEAGFHYDPRANPSAAVCHACGVTYSLEPSPDTSTPTPPPLAFHAAESPQCRFLTSVLARYTDLPPPPPHAAAASGQQCSADVVQQPSSQSSGSVAATPSSFPSRQDGGSDETDFPDLSEDGEAGPTTLDSTPSGDRMRRAQQSQSSTGYTLALSGSGTDQRSMPTDPQGRHQSGEREEDRPRLTLDRAVYPQLSTVQSRLATFKNWPLADLFSPQMLVMLGFFFAGYADCVRCFFCGVGLKSWDASDDVLTEHIRWRPNCGFLLTTKGRRFIQNTLNRLRANNQEPAEEHLPTPQPNTRPQCQVPANTNTSPRLQTAIPGTVSSINGGQGASGARGGSGSTLGGPREDLHTDGTAVRPRDDGNSQVQQRLLMMGFSSADISRAQARLRSSGEPDDFEHTLNILLPE